MFSSLFHSRHLKNLGYLRCWHKSTNGQSIKENPKVYYSKVLPRTREICENRPTVSSFRDPPAASCEKMRCTNRNKLTTRCDDRRHVAKFYKSRFLWQNSRRKCRLFFQIHEYPCNTIKRTDQKYSLHAKSQHDPYNRFDRTLTSDRQINRRTQGYSWYRALA